MTEAEKPEQCAVADPRTGKQCPNIATATCSIGLPVCQQHADAEEENARRRRKFYRQQAGLV